MIIEGKFGYAIVFTCHVEQEAKDQIKNILDHDIGCQNIRIMPDIHSGKGCTIGTTMCITDKVVPNLVGVDIGCLDKDTEILTPNGWIKISEYNNQKILVYNPQSDEATFEYPNAFIKNPCTQFYHLSNSKNLDQMVSAEHHMLVYQGNKACGFKLHDYTAQDFVNTISKLKKADNYTVKTTFAINNIGLPYNDNEIRVFVMISADARLRPLKNGNTYVELHLKKERKINRAKLLLSNINVSYHETLYKDGSICITFSSSLFNTKDLSQFFGASTSQLKVVCDEVCCWDGCVDKKRNHRYYSTNNKSNADVIQFAFNATGIRSAIYSVKYPDHPNWKTVHYVIPTKNAYVSYRLDMINLVASQDGYKYCFNTRTGAFVARRNNSIFVTGNCGMFVVSLGKIDIDLQKLDDVVHQIPSGMHVWPKPLQKFPLQELHCYSQLIHIERLECSLGTLGGGNHFIEVDKDDEGNQYLVIHSGSRNLGKQVAEIYQNIAIKECKEEYKQKRQACIQSFTEKGEQNKIEETLSKIQQIPGDLCYVSGENMQRYIDDIKICQYFARLNRENMAFYVFEKMGWNYRGIQERFHTVHNYIDTENMILRKGAISAQKGEKVLIPMNMQYGSVIAIGKGNRGWNCSAPHGAGRLMSRKKARETLSIQEYVDGMSGVFTTSVNKNTIDEAPMAYKPVEWILDNIKGTVDVITVIKPIYNFKASD